MAGKKIRNRHGSVGVGTLRAPVVATSNNTTSHNSNQKQQQNVEQLLGMTKEQLKHECRKRGQKTTGNKTELLQRLGYKMAAKRLKEQIGTTSSSSNGTAASSSSAPIITANDVSGGGGDPTEKAKRERERAERETLLLWKRPLITLEYAFREIVALLTTYGRKLLQHKSIVLLVALVILSGYVVINSAGPHQEIVQKFYKKLMWCLYWIGLGILSSVGLGTGLHTFLLYLGPHIAAVTLAAYECESLNFPEPPYPDEIVCPDDRHPFSVTILTIMSKVRLEAMCWGAGTALGELPPYFMARAARLSGIDPDEDDDFKELEELERKKSNRAELSLVERGKVFVEDLVQKVGFLGILACASIPNPLFDLAGITCGHFLVPFWTFFGATLIGKAVIKMHIQKLFVIIAFNETLIETALKMLERMPVIGGKLQTPFRGFLDGQKHKLHTRGKTEAGSNFLGAVFEKFVVAMIFYFVVSIVNSFAQSYHKRIHKKKTAPLKKD